MSFNLRKWRQRKNDRIVFFSFRSALDLCEVRYFFPVRFLLTVWVFVCARVSHIDFVNCNVVGCDKLRCRFECVK